MIKSRNLKGFKKIGFGLEGSVRSLAKFVKNMIFQGSKEFERRWFVFRHRDCLSSLQLIAYCVFYCSLNPSWRQQSLALRRKKTIHYFLKGGYWRENLSHGCIVCIPIQIMNLSLPNWFLNEYFCSYGVARGKLLRLKIFFQLTISRELCFDVLWGSQRNSWCLKERIKRMSRQSKKKVFVQFFLIHKTWKSKKHPQLFFLKKIL